MLDPNNSIIISVYHLCKIYWSGATKVARTVKRLPRGKEFRNLTAYKGCRKKCPVLFTGNISVTVLGMNMYDTAFFSSVLFLSKYVSMIPVPFIVSEILTKV